MDNFFKLRNRRYNADEDDLEKGMTICDSYGSNNGDAESMADSPVTLNELAEECQENRKCAGFITNNLYGDSVSQKKPFRCIANNKKFSFDNFEKEKRHDFY